MFKRPCLFGCEVSDKKENLWDHTKLGNGDSKRERILWRNLIHMADLLKEENHYGKIKTLSRNIELYLNFFIL